MSSFLFSSCATRSHSPVPGPEKGGGHSLIVMRELLVLLLPVTYSWLEERTYQIGAKNYTERREQPWFRYPHDDHDRVQTADKETSAFGKHFIPPDDEFVAPRWTLEEQRYLPCMTKECVCLYFRGRR